LLLLLLLLLLQREGNVLMSFNNRPATDSIPFLSPFLAPSARAVGPLLEQLATSPFRYALSPFTCFCLSMCQVVGLLLFTRHSLHGDALQMFFCSPSAPVLCRCLDLL
jgi:hypothetical protein